MSERLLRKLYLTQRRSVEEIAKFCGVDRATVYRYIKKYQLKR